jgi:putative hydrolase of the HAD superfamily
MRLYDDTFWTLNKFRKRYRLGIVSDAQRIFCKPELRTLRLENFFDAIVISSDYGFRKPDPRIFHMALAILDVPASEAVYIGNNYKTDLLGAKAAGLALAGLIRQSEDEKRAFGDEPKPDFVAKDLRDAFNEILQNNKAL